MVSKVEILEMLLKYGPLEQKKIRELFGDEINIIVRRLRNQGLIQAIIYEFDKEQHTYVKKILKPSEHRKNVILELSPRAYEYLNNIGVESFYDTPIANRSKTLLKNRKEFIKIG